MRNPEPFHPHPAHSNPDRPFKSRFAEPMISAAHIEWERLLDAGLIGKRPKTSPEVAANRERWDALFRDLARGRRR